MPTENQNRFETIYRWVARFSYLGLIFGLAFLILGLFQIAGHLESIAPAELKLLLQVFRNRFFQ
jgi:hypothetical protein